MIDTIKISEVAAMLDYKDSRSVKKWCANNSVAIISYSGSNKRFVIKDEFEKAQGEIVSRHSHIQDYKTSCKTPRGYSQSSLDTNNIRVTLACMEKPLFIPPGKRMRGLGLCVFCYKCQTNVIDICHNGNNGNVALKKCPFGNSHVFKVYKYLPGTSQRKTLKLETRNVNEAIQQAIAFGEKTVNGHDFVEPTISKNQKPDVQQSTRAPLVVDSISGYIKWLHGEGVPEHKKKYRSSHFIGEVERKLKLFLECLRKNEYDLSSLTMDQLNDKIVGEYYQYLKDQKRFGSNSFNKHLSYATSWLKWFSDEHYPVRNWFAPVKRRKSNHISLGITEDEYNALLKKITPENGIGQDGNGKKIQYFRYWLADAIRLGLETGRRREEILKLKFSGIEYDKNGRPEFITIDDFKVNRSQNRFTEEEKKYVKIPVTESLYQLLLNLNYEKYKNSDHYILAPKEKFQRTKAMKDTISRGFAQYIKQVTDRPLTFKCLRKTYITGISLYLGGNAKAITGHSTDAVIEGHYLVKEELARKAKGLSVFGVIRNEELKEIRTNSINHQTMEVEK